MLKYFKIENLTLFFYIAIAWLIYFIIDDYSKVDLTFVIIFLILHFIQVREDYKRK